MNTLVDVPPGFRFHPTEEELVDYYLRRKVNSRRIDIDVIKDVDLYKIEPWDLQELCRIGTEEQNEWYFFSHKDKKYPTGTRTNRATAAGFWKATGRDKAIYSKHDLIGMRKTLVFYQGRAPNGQKSDWIMHEYRLETDEINGTPQEEGWVVCRVFKKRITTMRRVMSEHESASWYDDQVSIMPDIDSPNQSNSQSNILYHIPHIPCKKELDNLPYQLPQDHQYYLSHLPHLESPKLLQSSLTCNSLSPYPDINNSSTLMPSSSLAQDQEHFQVQIHGQNLNNTTAILYGNASEQALDQVMDWRVFDKFVASQLSQEDVSKGNDNNFSSNASSNVLHSPANI